MLVVGNKSYMKLGDSLAAFPFDIGSMVQGIMGLAQEEALNGMSDVKTIGQEVVDGTPTMVYQYSISLKDNSGSLSSTNKIWIDTFKGLPVKQEIQGEFEGIISTTEQTITYDPSIKIEAPTP